MQIHHISSGYSRLHEALPPLLEKPVRIAPFKRAESFVLVKARQFRRADDRARGVGGPVLPVRAAREKCDVTIHKLRSELPFEVEGERERHLLIPPAFSWLRAQHGGRLTAADQTDAAR